MPKKTSTSDGSPFYTSNQDRFITEFNKTRQAVVGYLSKQLSPDTVSDINNKAAINFEKILPQLPYVGGDDHPGTKFIVNAGQWLAIYQSMVNRSYTAVEVAKMMYSIYEDQLNDISSDEVENERAFIFSDDYIHLMKIWAQSTSPYEWDWKADFVEGDGIEFDYGLDYRACPCFELFKVHNAKELAPFFCLLDFPESIQLNSGLVRTKTLAQGDDLCNFRYKKGREVIQSWETEVDKILTSAHS